MSTIALIYTCLSNEEYENSTALQIVCDNKNISLDTRIISKLVEVGRRELLILNSMPTSLNIV